jgi:hypothetical protein
VSFIEKITLNNFLLIIFVTHGGVFPKCEQGSNVTNIFEPLKFRFFFNAFASACGLPLKEVLPDDITELFFTTMHPTEGFSEVEPRLISA